jgi:uncharacterized protein with PQ loop repeat
MWFDDIGWNAGTGLFALIMATFAYGLYGLYRQALALRRGKTGRSVSVTMLTYGTMFFAACGIYGIRTHDAALLTGLVRAAVQLWPVGELAYRKGFTRRQWTLCGCWAAVLVLAATLPFRPLTLLGVTKTLPDWLQLFVGLGVVLSFLPQPLELLAEKCRGELSLQLLLSALVGIGFWTAYAAVLNVWPVLIPNVLMLVLMSATLILWLYYPNGPAAPAER